MILTMAAVAVTTRKTLERTCPKCGKKQIFPSNRINEVVSCPAARDRFRRKRGTKTSGKPTIPKPVYRLPTSENSRGGFHRKRSGCGRGSVVTLPGLIRSIPIPSRSHQTASLLKLNKA